MSYKLTEACGVPMEHALTPEQCEEVRHFFRVLLWAKKKNKNLTVGQFMSAWTGLSGGYKRKVRR